MAKIGMFWGSTTEMTSLAAELIQEALESFDHHVESFDIGSTGVDPILTYSNVIIGCPTWNVGELQDDWDMFYSEYQGLKFDGITGAFFGVGDQLGYSCNFLDAVGLLARPFVENGGILIGKWPTDGYDFDESIALEGDKFLGLGLDYDNQETLSEERIKSWTELIESSFK